jgi:hypothetical protein
MILKILEEAFSRLLLQLYLGTILIVQLPTAFT